MATSTGDLVRVFIYVLGSSVAATKNPLTAHDKAASDLIYVHLNRVSAGLFLVQAGLPWLLCSVRFLLRGSIS